ncbi:MAG TPA: helix-turn-helix transcriptional regulator [bacterium]|nr:helix-turn-helix transcriptional regulator [bacterium]
MIDHKATVKVDGFKSALMQMVNRGTSPERIAQMAGLNPSTIYYILNGNTKRTRIENIAKVADAMGYRFERTGDDVILVKEDRKLDADLDKEERKLLALYRELGSEDQDDVLDFVETLCKILERKKMKGTTGNED